MSSNYGSGDYLTSDEKLALARKIRQQYQRALGKSVEPDPEPVSEPSPEERELQAWREDRTRRLIECELDPKNFFLLSRSTTLSGG